MKVVADAIDCHGAPALTVAASENSVEMVKLLVEEFHADVRALDGAGRSASAVAARKGHTDIAEYLLEKESML